MPPLPNMQLHLRTALPLAMALAKRASTEANVSSKRQKVGREIDKLLESEVSAHWDKDLMYVTDTLKAKPHLMGKVKSVLAMDEQDYEYTWKRLHLIFYSLCLYVVFIIICCMFVFYIN